MKYSKKIRIVFDGPPSHESGRFIEVENEHGEGMSFGEWKQEGEFWYLEFSNPAILEAEDTVLKREIALKADYIKRLEAENDELKLLPGEGFRDAIVAALTAEELDDAGDGTIQALHP